MKHTSNKKDFIQDVNSHYFTGKYVAEKNWILDYQFRSFIFENLELVGGSFSCSHFQNCTFTNVLFESVNLDECNFKNCKFQNTIFRKCSTEGAKLIDCKGTPRITD